jgi:hypothetical protein
MNSGSQISGQAIFINNIILSLLAPSTNDTIFLIAIVSQIASLLKNELLPLLDKNGIKYWYSNEDIKAGESWVHFHKQRT